MKTAMMSLLAAMLLVAAQAYAQGWSDFATVSMTDPATPKLSANRLCYSDGRDVACDGAAGLLSASGSLVISTVAAGGLSVSGNTSLAAVSATNVSATGNVSAVKFIGDGSLLTGISGGGSSSATTAVSFAVHKNGTDQTMGANNTVGKLTWGTEAFDTNNNFASDRFTPTVAGKYLIMLKLGCKGYSAAYVPACGAYIYKNGANIATSYSTDSTDANQAHKFISAIVDMNGSTDYVEAYGLVYDTSGFNTPKVSGAATDTFFQGALLSPQTSSSGSSSSGDRIVSTSANIVAYAGGTISFTTGGTSGTTYFDAAGRHILPGISATTNQSSFTTIYASGNVGVGTMSPNAKLEVAGTISSSALLVNNISITTIADIGLEQLSAVANMPATSVTVSCPAGKKVIGGGSKGACYNGGFAYAYPNSANQFTAGCNGDYLINVTVYAICARLQ